MVTPVPAMHACLRRLLPALLIFPLAAHGTIVTTTVDEDNGSLKGGSGISLREAVKYSSAGATITFAPALSGQTIRLTLGELLISQSLTINGSALSSRVTISGDRTGNGKTPDDTNIFRVGADIIVLDSLIISGGYETQGGGIISNLATAKLTVNRCHFVGNSADVVGGAIFFSKSTGASIPTLTLSYSTFTGNSASNEGGAIYAIYPVQIQNSTFTGNTARDGGAIFLQPNYGPTSVFLNTAFYGNSATRDGGAIWLRRGSISLRRSTVAGNSATLNGGGIYSQGDLLELLDSTVSGNSALLDGGGIYTDSIYTNLRNSTVAQNSANSKGGGICVRTNLELESSTIAGNSAGASGGGLSFTSAFIRSSIVCGNSAPSAPEISGTFDASFGNLITPILSLAPLGNYGGPTQTMPPLPGSPAIDSANSGSPPSIDQRGYSRVNQPDIGAVEYQGAWSDDASIIYDIMPLIWKLDADGDGLPYAIERLHGTNPFVPDTSSASTLSSPVLNSEGKPVLTFIASQATGIPETHAFCYLMRSPGLSPGSWSEIYRFTPYGGYAKPGVTFTQVPDPAGGEKIRITVTDGNPLPGGGFYRFEAVLGPP